MPGGEVSIDYSEDGVWERLDECLQHEWQPRPAANCGRVDCEPGWSWSPNLKDYDLWFAVAGKGVMQIGGHEYAIRPGTLFLLRPGDRGRARQDPCDRLTVVFIHFDFYKPGSDARAAVDARWLPSRCVRFDTTGDFERLTSRIVRLIHGRQPLRASEAQFLLQQALVEVYRQDAATHGIREVHSDPRISRIVERLRRRPSERLSLEDAARMVSLSPRYFSRLFAAEMGSSYRAFALATRLERARFLLEETFMSVGEVASALGYADAFLFSRQFKEHFGVAPSDVRRAEVPDPPRPAPPP